MERSSMKKIPLFTVLALGIGISAWTADFGLVLNTEGEYVSDNAGAGAGFTGILEPWFSATMGEISGVYVSGKLAFEYEHESDAWALPPFVELERAEVNVRPLEALYLTLGRQWYRDDGGMIVSGLFDGLSAAVGLGGIRLFAGAFYTGFLYKKTAEIFMTAGDRAGYNLPLDYGDPDTYFASRRLFVPLRLEFPDLSPRVSLSVTVIGQFDMNVSEDALHSQYLEACFGLEAADSLRFAFTAIGVLAETKEREPAGNFAAALRADWDVPGAAPDMLSGELRWGSGVINEAVIAFAPVSGIAQGRALGAAMPGMLNARLSYTDATPGQNNDAGGNEADPGTGAAYSPFADWKELSHSLAGRPSPPYLLSSLTRASALKLAPSFLWLRHDKL
jgi:hypothetical protein